MRLFIIILITMFIFLSGIPIVAFAQLDMDSQFQYRHELTFSYYSVDYWDIPVSNPATLSRAGQVVDACLWGYFTNKKGKFRRQLDPEQEQRVQFGAQQKTRITQRITLQVIFRYGLENLINTPGVISDQPYRTPFNIEDGAFGDFNYTVPKISLTGSYQILPKVSIGLGGSIELRDGIKDVPSLAKIDTRAITIDTGVEWNYLPNQYVGLAVNIRSGQSRSYISDHLLDTEPFIVRLLGDMQPLPAVLMQNYHNRRMNDGTAIKVHWHGAKFQYFYWQIDGGMFNIHEKSEELKNSGRSYASPIGKWYSNGFWGQYQFTVRDHDRNFKYQFDGVFKNSSVDISVLSLNTPLEHLYQNWFQTKLTVSKINMWNRVRFAGNVQFSMANDSYNQYIKRIYQQRTARAVAAGALLESKINKKNTVIIGAQLGKFLPEYHYSMTSCGLQDYTVGMSLEVGRRIIHINTHYQIFKSSLDNSKLNRIQLFFKINLTS